MQDGDMNERKRIEKKLINGALLSAMDGGSY